MSELKIRNITLEDFKAQYHLSGFPGEIGFTKGYEITELEELMKSKENHSVYYLIEGKLYEVPQTQEERSESHSSMEVELQRVEVLNDQFRDALIGLREYLYQGNGRSDSIEAKAIRAEMKQCVEEAQAIVKRCQIKNKEQLKANSKKYFLIEFLSGIFGDEIYNTETEIDCGL